MDISDFHLEKAIFEYRYSPSYLLWDRAGSIWSEALTRWPQLKLVRGEPTITSFTLENTYELSVTIDKSSVIAHHPKPDLSDFIQKAVHFLTLTVKHLDILEYTRIGFRLLYFRSYPTEQAASNAFLECKTLVLPEGPHFGLVDGGFSLPEYAVRWEGKAAAVTIRLRTEGRKLDFDPPMGVRELKAVHDEKFGIVFDVDHYTKGTVLSGQFRASEWIGNALHVTRRDSKNFLRA